MRVFLVLVVLLFGCASIKTTNSDYRLYQLSDMEDVLQDYYANDLKRISPGLACGNFKMNNILGCFKLIVDERRGKVVRLIYDDLSSGEKKKIFTFVQPLKNIYIEKMFLQKLETTRALPDHEEVILKDGQPSLRLVFFEKSAVVFYWKNGEFKQIWTAD